MAKIASSILAEPTSDIMKRAHAWLLEFRVEAITSVFGNFISANTIALISVCVNSHEIPSESVLPKALTRLRLKGYQATPLWEVVESGGLAILPTSQVGPHRR
jgi:hypothetical protein